MKTWTTKDKSDWPDGVWKDEPDKAQWINEEAKLDCLIVRGPTGALCGYVGVPESHPYFKKDYDYNWEGTNVHGGITFAALCDPSGAKDRNICHTGDIANKLVWWLGFDCNHSGDYAPDQYRGEDHSLFVGQCDTYRSFNYVTNQVDNLAIQLAGV